MEFRNLEKIRFVIKDATGLDIMYAYDDLVFPEHGVFLLQYSANNNELMYCHFHQDCPDNKRSRILSSLKRSGALSNLSIQEGNSYELKTKNDTQIEIKFADL